MYTFFPLGREGDAATTFLLEVVLSKLEFEESLKYWQILIECSRIIGKGTAQKGTQWELPGELCKGKVLFQYNKQGNKIDGRSFKEAPCEADIFLIETGLERAT